MVVIIQYLHSEERTAQKLTYQITLAFLGRGVNIVLVVNVSEGTGVEL